MYTVAEVAKELGCITAWVRVLCQTGRLDAKKIGRDWVILDMRVKKKKKTPRKIRSDKDKKLWANGFKEMKKQKINYDTWEAKGLPDDLE